MAWWIDRFPRGAVRDRRPCRDESCELLRHGLTGLVHELHGGTEESTVLVDPLRHGDSRFV